MLFVEYIKLFKHGLLLNSFYYSNNEHMMDFFNFFKSKKSEESGELSPNPFQMATAVLLIEMARADFDQAENYYKEAITIPMFPTLKDSEQFYVIDKIREITN